MQRLIKIAEKAIPIRTNCMSKRIELMAKRALMVRELKKKVERLYESGYQKAYNK